MRNKVSEIIRILGFGLNEIVMNLPLDIGRFDSIEYDKDSDKVYLHIFEKNDIDIIFDFDELSEPDQLKIYSMLAIYYN